MSSNPKRFCHRGRRYAIWSVHAIGVALVCLSITSFLYSSEPLALLVFLPFVAIAHALGLWLPDRCWIMLDESAMKLTVKNTFSSPVDINLDRAHAKSQGWFHSSNPKITSPRGIIQIGALGGSYDFWGGADPDVDHYRSRLAELTAMNDSKRRSDRQDD